MFVHQPQQTLKPFIHTSQARFGHLTIYGACYYSYLYARCLSQALWDVHLADDPLNREAGMAIRTTLLEPGGAQEPVDLMMRALGSSGAQVLHQRSGGWSPNPDLLLNAVHPG